MKYRWRAGDTAYIIVLCEVHQRMKNSTILSFWTGEKFASGGSTAYRESKLFKTHKDAEIEAVKVVLTNPERLMGKLEVMEQPVWEDIRA